ncbi:hypothetical protein OH77DRAFT_1297992 [Trametes cingulata]|nr:hypothetical protein OH77DRAFT_1297992 [Trametes cingulata]
MTALFKIALGEVLHALILVQFPRPWPASPSSHPHPQPPHLRALLPPPLTRGRRRPPHLRESDKRAASPPVAHNDECSGARPRLRSVPYPARPRTRGDSRRTTDDGRRTTHGGRRTTDDTLEQWSSISGDRAHGLSSSKHLHGHTRPPGSLRGGQDGTAYVLRGLVRRPIVHPAPAADPCVTYIRRRHQSTSSSRRCRPTMISPRAPAPNTHATA